MTHRSSSRALLVPPTARGGPFALAILVLGLGVSVPAAATADDTGPNAATSRAYQRLRDRFDANRDGVLQVAELPEGMRAHLGRADTDHDGAISLAGVHAFGVARRAARFAKADVTMTASPCPPRSAPHAGRFSRSPTATARSLSTKSNARVASGILHRPDEDGDR